MDRVLTILEVSRKQDYIFSSKKLRENADRSNEIAYGYVLLEDTSAETLRRAILQGVENLRPIPKKERAH